MALRYLEALPPAEVQRRLAVGRSEYFRLHDEGLAAVTAGVEDLLQPASPEVPFLLSPVRRPSALPAPLTSFVGREREVSTVKRLLAQAPLVTLLGPPGTGKTRLAVEVATHLAMHPPDGLEHGVCFVPLAPLREPGLVAPTIAMALGIRESGSRPAAERLKDELTGKRLLLVLDNFEQTLDAAPLIADLLSACPGVRALVTSRAVLRVAGEQAFPVPPLALPDLQALPPADELPRYSAVRLFVERARAARPDFALTPANAAPVAEVCARLDGLPLALELAAARVRHLSVAEIAARLGGRFRLLTGGSRTAEGRHQTLLAAVDWSYALLAEPERTLLGRLAVFAGGWTLAAAEAACGDDREDDAAPAAGAEPTGDEPDRPAVRRSSAVLHREDALALLSRLVDQSLVVAGEGGDGTTRFRLLETLRAYAHQRLAASGEEGVIRDRHALHYLRWAEAGGDSLQRRYGWWAVESETENLRSALEWLTQRARAGSVTAATRALRLASRVAWSWQAVSYAAEGRQWIELLLELPAAQAAPAAARAAAHCTAAYAAALVDEPAMARRRFGEALELARSAGDTVGVAWALGGLGWVAADVPSARAFLEESVALHRQLGDTKRLAQVLMILGHVLQHDETAAARALIEESLRLRPHHNGLRWLGEVALIHGDVATAHAALNESLALTRANAITGSIADTLIPMATLARLEGDLTRAHALLTESLALSRQFGRRHGVAAALEGLALVAAAAGDTTHALRLAGAAAAVRQTIAGPVPLGHQPDRSYASELERIRGTVPREVADSAWAEGQAMSLELAIALALEDGPSALSS
jgi:non-specific serine/threonine protein kinase